MHYSFRMDNNPWFSPMTPSKGQPAQSGPGASVNVAAPGIGEVYAKLLDAMKRIAQLEAQVIKLDGALHVDAGGDVELRSAGSIRLHAARQLVLEGGNQGTVVKDSSGNSLSMGQGSLTLAGAAKIQLQTATLALNAGSLNAAAAMSKFTGVVKCDTLIATTVVASTYTPGAGNIW